MNQTCTQCGSPVIAQRTWTAASAEQRAVWRSAGFRKLQGRGRCWTCYQRMRRDGDIPATRELTPPA